MPSISNVRSKANNLKLPGIVVHTEPTIVTVETNSNENANLIETKKSE